MDFESLSDKAILEELGSRIRRRRLARNISQNEVALHAGVAKKVVQKIEGGEVCTTNSMIRILRALGFIKELDQFLPDLGLSPLQLVEFKGQQRIRASGPHKDRKST